MSRSRSNKSNYSIHLIYKKLRAKVVNYSRLIKVNVSFIYRELCSRKARQHRQESRPRLFVSFDGTATERVYPPMNIQWRGLDRFHPRKISIPRIIIITRSRWWEWKEGAKERGRGGTEAAAASRNELDVLAVQFSYSVETWGKKEVPLSRNKATDRPRESSIFPWNLLWSAADLRIDREY